MQENTGSEDIYKTMDYSAEYSENLPAILKHLNISLAFTSYQASRLMLVRSDGEELDINFKTFPRPMGLTVTHDSLTLGVFTQIIRFQREDGLIKQIKQPLSRIEEDVTAPKAGGNQDPLAWEHTEVLQNEYQKTLQNDDDDSLDFQKQFELWQQYQESLYEPADSRVDACFITRASHYSGMINIHDISWGEEGLWAVNSSFSCLCTLQSDFSFVPRWQPPFITELKPEDRCHLNGMTLRDGKPGYVTTFSKQDSATQWRQNKNRQEGTLIDVQNNEILVEGLWMPHSPRWYQGRLYFCNSGIGAVCRYDFDSGKVETVAQVPGFTRGMAFHGPLMFVGLSRVRQSDVTRPAPLGEMYDETLSGIWVFNLEDFSEVARLTFRGNVDQIYDVAVIPGCHFPEIIEPSNPRMRNHFCFPAV